MNHIPTRQNEQKQLERLAAQRELYSAAKVYHGWQIILNVVAPITLSVAAIIWTSMAPWAAAFGLLVVFFDSTLLEPATKKKRTKAAKIQELFDCDVFELPASPLKTVDDITVEEVLTYYDAHRKIPTNIEKIKDWYPISVGSLPLSIGRLICQRSNCWWDSRLRERYSSYMQTAGYIVTVVIVLAGIAAKLSFTNVVLVASVLSPFFQFCMKQNTEQREAAQRLNELANYAKCVWSTAFSHDEAFAFESSRRLQDEIFEHRSKSPVILDFFYNWLRDKDEDLMNRSAEIMIKDAQQHLV
ncbi:S-4TM family putative pore-forming effector [Fibrivirga algicola]|jgi:hypothetical protein|uniref:SMODS and SLOG-associating 2TM effector domain-containing protein n=1 Tax=Fibrivirga algicola TaxID=2950420 RepID=A0ABX0QNF7_9BACT|nr:S-4TM family putative pore-forming effector [Fibrivirga algicola]NID13677.1 hypothetical protein [Fibrivirga algicola]